MKAIQTRSPIHLAYEYANLNNVIVSIWVDDTVNIDSTTTPDYQLNSQAINDFATVEISELIRSKNDYIFNPDFYEKRDTAKYVLIRGELLDSSNSELEVKYDFLRVRDGYVTREDQPQIFKNLIEPNFPLWELTPNASITGGQNDPFNGTNAYLINDIDDANQFVVSNPLSELGEYTLRVFIKKNSSGNLYSIGTKPTKRVIFDILNNTVTNNVGGLEYDLRDVGGYKLLSVVVNVEVGESFRIVAETVAGDEQIFVFNPTATKGNLLNSNASDLILQDNKTIFSNTLINAKIGFDKKLANTTYSYVTGLSFTSQSVFRDVTSSNLTYDQLEGTITTQAITLKELEECKHTPAKVSFINRFGVLQDLVFFKKRTDNIDTDKESYKTNVLQQGNYYPHIGQNQTIRKESKRSVTLNSGFYPEKFNTVFEQLQNSLHYWIDDEPAVLDSSSFNVKTRVNDKLINYTFDFSYSNEEVNTI